MTDLIAQMQANIRTRSVYFALALTPLFAWLIISGVYIGLLASHADPTLAGHHGGDAIFPKLRQLDALWPFVTLALYQLLVLKPAGKRALDAIVWLALITGVGLCIARQLAPVDMRSALHLAEVACTIVIAAMSVQRTAAFLGGRGVDIADLWAFLGLQWLLVWTGAGAYLAWTQNPAAGLPEDRRLFLFELATFGTAVHVLAAMALRSLQGALGPVVRQRAGLLALAAYNLGAVLLVCNLKPLGGVVMLVGLALLLPALWPEKGLGRMLLMAVAFLVLALCILPWERSAFSAWRHGVSAGVIGLGTLIAAAVAMSAVLPKRARPRRLPPFALLLFALGVALRMATEMLFQWRQGTSIAMAFSAALELAGAILISLALLRGMRALGQRIR